jgi:hypothetical protein
VKLVFQHKTNILPATHHPKAGNMAVWLLKSYYRLAMGSPAYTSLQHPVFPIVRVLSSNLLPDFIGPQVLSTIRESAIFCALPGFRVRLFGSVL